MEGDGANGEPPRVHVSCDQHVFIAISARSRSRSLILVSLDLEPWTRATRIQHRTTSRNLVFATRWWVAVGPYLARSFCFSSSATLSTRLRDRALPWSARLNDGRILSRTWSLLATAFPLSRPPGSERFFTLHSRRWLSHIPPFSRFYSVRVCRVRLLDRNSCFITAFDISWPPLAWCYTLGVSCYLLDAHRPKGKNRSNQALQPTAAVRLPCLSPSTHLPQHPAVAYLFLVRSHSLVVKTHVLILVALLVVPLRLARFGAPREG
jgi:hypothetical protein